MRVAWFVLVLAVAGILSLVMLSYQLAGLPPDLAANCEAAVATTGQADDSKLVRLGPGNTNALYIDDDSDGYGVAAPKGPDADDADPEVNTPESVLKKYGSVETFLGHLGYKPARIFYLSPKGDDSRGHSGAPDRPYRTFKKMAGSLQAGDLVLFAAGKYTGDKTAVDIDLTRGKPDNPIVLLAWPGASVVLEGPEHCVQIQASRGILLDGFTIDRADPGGGDGIRMVKVSQVVLKNMEIKNQFWGVKAMQDIHNLRLERLVIHDNPVEHGVYLGCRELINSDIFVRRCLMYRNAMQGFQHNGRVKNLLLEDNVFHTNGQAGVQLMMGVCDSVVRRNLIFNNAKQGVSFFNYISSQSDILPADMHGNVVEGNIIWVGGEDWHNEYPTQTYAPVQFNDATGAKRSTMSGNVIRGNVLVSSQGGIVEFRQPQFAADVRIEGNLFYRTSGQDRVLTLGDKPCNLEAFNTSCENWKNNTFADPRFRRAADDLCRTPEQFDLRFAETWKGKVGLRACKPGTTQPAGEDK